ncbi:redoxin domain-containing protein [Sphingobacterium corticis]|uniref:Redoxin domain-containing protein n=1 Tax=Sphingobacterium corticis TaxID=1812823 RepID=A0ABW5NKR8_9SPHI
MHTLSILRFLLICFFALTSYSISAQKNNLGKQLLIDVSTELPHRIEVNKPVAVIFLSPECPLCQNYTQTINQLHQQYNQQIEFIGIFPGKAYGSADIKQFAAKYKIAMALYQDPNFQFTRALEATVTPSVALYDKGGLQYFGAIDNALRELGKKRVVVTELYLQDAIASLLQNKPISVKKTVAKGCFINTR